MYSPNPDPRLVFFNGVFLIGHQSIVLARDENGRKRYIILLFFSKTDENGREISILMNSSI